MARPCPRRPTRPGLAVRDRPPSFRERMAGRLRVYRTCKVLKVFGSPCGHRLEGTAQSYEAYREADREK